MFFDWNGLRLSAVAAVAMFLLAGSPVQAKMYTFTMTGVRQNGSSVTGSVKVDSMPVSLVSHYNEDYGHYRAASYVTNNASGIFAKARSNVIGGYGNDFYLTYYLRRLTVGFGIDNNSREDDNYRDDHSIRRINDLDDSSLLFTSAAVSSGLYNEFELGTYALADPKSYSETPYYDLLSDAADSESGEHLNLVSGLLRIGPAAPAPLVGGGLLSALAALLGLGLTRFGRRRNVLA